MAPKSSSLRGSPSHHSHPSIGTLHLSPHWFFPDGDLLLRCNSTLYLVHSEVLSSASGVFRDALRRPAPTPPHPTSSSSPSIFGADKCRIHTKGTVRVALGYLPGLSLSAQLWLRRNQRRQALGKPAQRWGTGKTARQPKVLVIEDLEYNVSNLLYFLYSRPYVLWLSRVRRGATEGQATETPVTKDSLPHILSLGMRYQIAAFTSASLSVLKSNAGVHPLFVIRTLQLYMPPTEPSPSSSSPPPPPPPRNTTMGVISQIYNLAISALLDDLPRFVESPDPRVREDFLASVPPAIRTRCVDRWNRYVWEMTETQDFADIMALMVPEGGTEPGKPAYEFAHNHDCCDHVECTLQVHIVMVGNWLAWWREGTRKGRIVPPASGVKRYLEIVEKEFERIRGQGRWVLCSEAAVKGVREMLAKVVGRGILEGGEGYRGLTLDE